MTKDRQSFSLRATSDFYENIFRRLPGERSARIFPSNVFMKPASATVDSDGNLRWTWPQQLRLQKFPSEVCFEFARLSDASDEQVRRSAGRWGPLYFGRGMRERTDDWREYARLIRAFLRYIADPRQVEDWKMICRSFAPGVQLEETDSIPEQRALTAAAVNYWYDVAHGHQILEYVGGRFQLRPGGTNLFVVLFTQLAHKMAFSDQTAICSGCNEAFAPKRLPPRGSRIYCPRCRRKKLPERDAARDYRRRKRVEIRRK
jgi:hypothetical protein